MVTDDDIHERSSYLLFSFAWSNVPTVHATISRLKCVEPVIQHFSHGCSFQDSSIRTSANPLDVLLLNRRVKSTLTIQLFRVH